MGPAAACRGGLIPTTVLAGVVGGAPSTLHALLTGRDGLEALRAAGTIVAPHARGHRLLGAGAVVHALVSTGWTAALMPFVRRSRRPVLAGMALGLAVGALDLAIARRRFPRLAALPRWPQVADHVAFGALIGLSDSALGRREPRR